MLDAILYTQHCPGSKELRPGLVADGSSISLQVQCASARDLTAVIRRFFEETGEFIFHRNFEASL